MDSTKIKIKEAAAEQKLDPQELLLLLQKWEIVTDRRKSAGASITMAEYEKFKAKRKESEAPQRVKVRRNNRNAAPEAPRTEAKPAAEAFPQRRISPRHSFDLISTKRICLLFQVKEIASTPGRGSMIAG